MKKLLKEFLETSKKQIGQKNNITYVIGNESCDLDSIAGSICLAFYKQQKDISNNYIPIINCNHNDIKFRFEFMMISEKIGLNVDELIYIDQIDLEYNLKNINQSVILYDHNIPSPRQSYLKNYVTEIIDHHEDKSIEYNYENPIQKDISLMGSACSKVCKYYMEQQEIDESVLILLLGAILIDTVNFDLSLKGKRWVEDDAICKEYILNQLINVDSDAFFDELLKVKFDTKLNLACQFKDLFNKDAKDFKYPFGKFKYAGILVRLRELFEHYGLDYVENFITEQIENYEVVVIMTQYFDSSQQPNVFMMREAMFMSKNQIILEKIQEVLSNNNIQFDKSLFDPQFTQFKHLTLQFSKPEYSRKLLEPLIASIQL